MKCHRCHKEYGREEPRCPHCGDPNPALSGFFQTSSVLISSGGADRIYRSVEEVPERLRTRLEKSTSSANSATILIADRRGRREIARAFRGLPEGAQRRLMRAIGGAGDAPGQPRWLTPRGKRLVLAALLVLVLALIAVVFTSRWQ